MAFFFYGKGDHPGGFVGYRVATTLGVATEYRQSYFSLVQYSPREAKRHAQTLDKKWRADADAVKRDGLLERKRPYSGPGVIVMGLRAYIKVERGRKAHYGTYVTPSFVVGIPGHGKGQHSFATTKLGFDCAYDAAVDCFCRLHCLSATDRDYLLSLKPSRELFTDTLRLELLKRGVQVGRDEIKGKLQVNSSFKSPATAEQNHFGLVYNSAPEDEEVFVGADQLYKAG